MFSVIQSTSLAGVLKMPRVKPLNKKINIINSLLCWNVTLLMFIQTLATARTTKVTNGWPYGRFWKFFNGSAKSPRVLPSSWILNECNLYCEILLSVRGLHDKNSASYYCFTSDVMYKWYKRLVYTHPDLLARFCERKKFGLIF